MLYDVLVIGGGPAGLTAGLYTSRLGLKSVLVEGGIFGGQMVNARLIENYPGFPEGISGFDLAALMHDQASKFGLETVTADVTGIEPGRNHRVVTDEVTYESTAVVLAAGSDYRKLNVPGEEAYIGRGISYCATCDGPLYRDETVAVVGGGDTAVSDALELAEHASKVFLIHRRDQLRASQVLQQRVLSHPKVEPLWSTVVEGLSGDSLIEAIRLRNVISGDLIELPLAGLFVAIGFVPRTQLFSHVLDLTETGQVRTDTTLATSVRGIFAAGDIRMNSSRQIAGAVGDGALAALSAFRYVREIVGQSQV